MSNFVAIIPAAGDSSRYSGEIPKQFLRVDGRTVLELSIKPLLDFSECLGVCVLVPPEDQYHKALEIKDNPKIFLVEGGTSRIDSVSKGVKFWQQSELSYDYILIHDAARPCLRSSDVQQLLDSIDSEVDGVVLGIPCSDTIKKVSAEGSLVLNTLDRSKLWRAFTPQIFRKEVLQKNSLEENIGKEFTDEASLVEANGGKLKMVKGFEDNIKLTFPEDLGLIKSILSSQGRLES
jgi:2-C-methyl-D-erythritol 4-phosphate cytidylyltransferase